MPEEKKVHRLVPSSQEKESPKIPSPEERPSVSLKQTPEPSDSQDVGFEKLEIHVEDVEEQWDGNSETATQGSAQGRWVRGAVATIAVGCVAVLVWGVTLLQQPEEQAQETVEEQTKEEAFEALYLQRKMAVMRYFAAQTVEQKAQFVRDRDRVQPLMLQHYARFPLKPARQVFVRGEHPKLVQGTMFWNMHVDVDGKRKTLAVESLESGEAFVDWEVEAGHQPDEFESFFKNRSSESHTFRAFVRGAQRDGFHGFEFEDYNKYRCYMVNIPNYDDYLWAYTEVGTALDTKWVNFITEGRRKAFDRSGNKPVMLQLRFPENAQSKRCVHLGELLSPGWVAAQ